jgi:hypothetical protein
MQRTLQPHKPPPRRLPASPSRDGGVTSSIRNGGDKKNRRAPDTGRGRCWGTNEVPQADDGTTPLTSKLTPRTGNESVLGLPTRAMLRVSRSRIQIH